MFRYSRKAQKEPGIASSETDTYRMKIKVMAIVDRYEKDLTDHQKVMAGFLTHLHHTYPDNNCYRLFTRDAKVILNIHQNSVMPSSFGPFKIARLNNMVQYWALLYSDYDTGDTVEWTITDPRAIAINAYLQSVCITEDLEDYSKDKKLSDYRENANNGNSFTENHRFTHQQIKDLFDFDV